jgi:hypothetical protein
MKLFHWLRRAFLWYVHEIHTPLTPQEQAEMQTFAL